jgi:uncharacterized membrane protein
MDRILHMSDQSLGATPTSTKGLILPVLELAKVVRVVIQRRPPLCPVVIFHVPL